MLKLIPFELNEKRILEALLFDYFKEIDASKIVVHGHAEKLNYPYLDQYWNDVNRQAMKITFNDVFIGFALINDKNMVIEFNAAWTIAEFYIKPRFRKKGFGSSAATMIFNLNPGKWEVKQSSNNKASILFWRKTIHAYSVGKFNEVVLNQKEESWIFQLFEVP